jgi:hypothetical protein
MFNILSIDVELSNVGLYQIRTFFFCMGDYLIDAIMHFLIFETFNVSSQRYEGIFMA